MPAKRLFTPDELGTARAMFDARQSWRAIGRELGCNEDTIRREIEPEYGASRSAGIISAERIRLGRISKQEAL